MNDEWTFVKVVLSYYCLSGAVLLYAGLTAWPSREGWEMHPMQDGEIVVRRQISW